MDRLRIASLIALAFVIGGGLAVRLFFVSLIQHDEYVAQAQEQQNVVRQILPKRGDIYIQDVAAGKPAVIAKSVEVFTLTATPKHVEKKAEYAKLIANFAKVDEKTLLEEFETNNLYMNPIKYGLSKQEVELIAHEINLLENGGDASLPEVKVNFDSSQGSIIYFLGGVLFIREFQRAYPEGGLLGQTLGFVNNEGVGQYGFEGKYDKELKGYSGKVLLEKDSLGNLLKLHRDSLLEGRDGTSYELTIDRNIQYVVEKELAAQIKDSEAEGGSVIIMDPKTGEITAMASLPSYEPANFREVAKEQVYLFDNPVISREWEPGSIFKPLVMSMALDLGLVTPQTKEEFGESVTVDGHVINTALRKAYGVENMSQVLANSDNVAMVWVANKVGNENMADYLRRYGFGQYTGIDLKNEIAGKVLPVEKWRNINRATISFGQGIAVTPMQVATAYAAVANNGKMIQPRIVKAVVRSDGTRQEVAPIEGEQVIKPEISKQLRDMMVATVLNAHSRAGVEGYKIGGKTGTAQIPDPEKGGYIEDAYNHSFVGFGPSDDPKYVMLVKLDHPNLKKVGLYAEGSAVPLFGRITQFLLNYYQIPPTNR